MTAMGRLKPIFLVSPRYRNEVAAAIESCGQPVVAARRARDAERRFAQSGASLAVVDARGALSSGLDVARAISGTVEVMGGALLILLSRGDADALTQAYEAGATHFLMSPFGVSELAQAIRFAERLVRRVAACQLDDLSRTEATVETTPLWRWQTGMAEIRVTPAFAVLLAVGHDVERLRLHTLWRMLDAEGRLLARDALRRLLSSGRPTAFAHRITIGGRVSRFAHHLRLDRDDEGHVLGISATVEDLEAASVERRQSSNFDQLTRLANAGALRQWIDARLGGRSPYDPAVILLLIAIGRFDEINAAYGRNVGDALLQAIATRIGRMIDDDDGENALVARLGGAEFAIALDGPVTLNDAAFLAQRLGTSFERPFLCEGHLVHLTCRTGIAVGEASLPSGEILLRRASAALAQAKDQEPNSYQVYLGDAEGDALKERATLESDLYRAISEGDITILYQPQVDIGRQKIVGVEALARWQHPRLGVLSAETLLSVAERAEILAPLGEHILAKALESAARWPDTLRDVRLSVNLGAADLVADEFDTRLLQRVAASGFDGRRLTLEVTEGSLIENLERAASMLANFRSHGLRIAIDDFGTGYSSLAYLKALPLDYLKLDKHLAQDIVGSPRDRIVVGGVIEMARSLDLGVIAEGVETEEQLQMLARAGCTLYQGYLCAPALTLDELVPFVEGWAATQSMA